MSQTSANPPSQTANSHFGSNHPTSKINTYVGTHLQFLRIFPSQQAEYQRFSVRWFQGMTFKAKALALVIAVATLPLFANRTSASYFTSQSISELTAQSEQARINDTEDIVSGTPSELPLTLMIETVVASLLLVGLLTAFFANRAMRPVKASAQEDESSPKLAEAPLQLAALPSFTIDTLKISEQQLAAAEQAKLLTEITLRLRQAQYLDDLLRTTVKEMRRAINAERVFIYRFNPDWSGLVVAESVLPGLPSCLKIKVTDTYFTAGNPSIDNYKNGLICITDDIYQANLTDCHIKLLEQFAIKSQMVAPILKNKELFALMIANQCSEPRHWQQHEIDLFVQLAKHVGFGVEQVNFLEKQEADAERNNLITEITLRLRQVQSLEDLLKTTVKEVRRAIKSDRVLVYGLDSTDWAGIVVAESVAPGWPQTLRVRLSDSGLEGQHIESYKNGEITTINDIYQDLRVTDSYRQILEQFAVKAQLVAPILKNNQLLGLLIAHQCSESRNWQQDDIDLFSQLATQIGFAIEQVTLLEEMEKQTKFEEV